MSKAVTPKVQALFDEIVVTHGLEEHYAAKGLEKGREEGAEIKQVEIATSLLDLLTDQVIATKVGLPLEKVQALRQASGQ